MNLEAKVLLGIATAGVVMAGVILSQTSNTPSDASPIVPDTRMQANGLPDYTDKSYQCTNEGLQSEVTYLWKGSIAEKTYGARVLYVKDAREVERSKDQLVCYAYIKATAGLYTDMYRITYHNEEGKALIGIRSASY